MKLVVENLEYWREVPIFANLSFQANLGDIVVIRGRNGSGKSTFLRIMGGVLEPTKGKIYVCEDLIKVYVGHKNGLKPYITVRQFIKGLQNPQITKDILQKIGLNHRQDDYIGTLSAGMQRRLAFAKPLSTPHSIWLLDEPFTNIDEEYCVILTQAILRHAEEGGLIILTSHCSLPFTQAQEVWLHG